MIQKSEPWYLHVGLYVIIAILAYILIRVAIINPTEYVSKQKYYTEESHSRMNDIRQAQVLWEKQHRKYSDNLDSLINFIKTDSTVLALVNGVDTLTNRSTNPFVTFSSENFTPESLMYSPESHKPFILKIDTTQNIDTVINMRGKIVRVDTSVTIGSMYLLESPDGFGSIGDLENSTRKNVASWE